MGEWIVVRLTREQVLEAHQLATETLAAWQRTGRAGHYPNKIETHFKGKLGELGVEQWSKDAGIWVESPFRDAARQRAHDVTVVDHHLEVKTWDFDGWEAWGRCIRPGQVPALRAKADAVVWCTVEGAREEPGTVDVLVRIAGWSTIEEIERTPVTTTGPQHNRLTNHQVAETAIRDPSDL